MSTHVKITKPITDRRTAFYRWIALSLLTGIGLVALYAADHALRLEQQAQQKYRLERVTRLVLSRLNTAIQIPLDTVASIHAFMLASPELPDFESFDRFAAQMLRHASTVDGFAFVDSQRIIRHFYPLAGNEKAIGLDLMTRPAARYVERAIRQKSIVLNTPTVTVQGRLSTIARIPLYHGEQLLGLVQGVIDINKTLELVMQDMDSDVHVELEDSSGRHFWGPSQYPAQAREFNIKAGDSHWLARVWLTPTDIAGSNTMIWLVWVAGTALLLSMLFIVNRMFTESLRLTKAIQNKTAPPAIMKSPIVMPSSRNTPLPSSINPIASPEAVNIDWIIIFVLVLTSAPSVKATKIGRFPMASTAANIGMNDRKISFSI